MAEDSNSPAICCESVWWCLFVAWDTLKWTKAEISCVIDRKKNFFNRLNVRWCLPQHIASILGETHADHQVITYGSHYYSEWNDGQNEDFALFKSIKRTNLDIKTQLVSIWSISCNIQHLAQKQGQHKIRWSMLWKWTCRHVQRANRANRQSSPLVDIIKRMEAWVAWSQKRSERWEDCAAYDPKRCFWQRKDEICTL